jgi:cobalt transporter subunit CbtA
MLFRRIVLSALLVGALSGLLLSAVQRWQIIPIIDSAERFEKVRTPEQTGPAAQAGQAHDHAAHESAGHVHPAGAWGPAEGAERIGYTVLSNVLTAAGFALLMLAAMSTSLRRAALAKRTAVTQLDWRCGLLWGLAGYAVFFVAPALGLPPEIPGAAAAPLEARQLWWVLTVVCTAAGLAGAAFGKTHWRWAALGLLAVPHLVGVPHPATSPFADHPPAAAAELVELARQFVWATAFANALLWLALGFASIWAARRWLLKEAATKERG